MEIRKNDMTFSVTASMFYKSLLEKGPVFSYPKEFHDEAILTTQIWTPHLSSATNYMYLLRSEDLMRARVSFSHCVLVCCGRINREQFALLDPTCDYLFLESCEDVADLTNMILDVINSFRHWRNRINDILLTSESFSDVLNASRRILDMEFLLFDSKQKCIALSKHFFPKYLSSDAGQNITDDYITSLFADDEHGYDYYTNRKGITSIPSDPAHGNTFLVRNIFYHDNCQATLIGKISGRELLRGDFQLFETLGEMMEKYYEKYFIHSHNNSDDARLIQYFSSLVDGNPSNETDVTSLLAYRQWTVYDSWQAIKFQFISRAFSPYSSDYFCTLIERMIPESTAFIHGGEIFCVVNLTAASEVNIFTPSFSAFLRDNLCKIGISSICRSVHELHQYYVQARLALILGENRQPSLWLYHFSDYTLDYILMQTTREYPARELIHPGILKLLDHDRNCHTEYFHTLDFYLEENQNAARTAERLYINRSTLLKRLARIRKLTGMNLHNRRERSYIELSLLLLEEENNGLSENKGK